MLELFASAAGIQPSTAAPEAGLMEQEQHYPCPAILPRMRMFARVGRFSTVDVG